jgi:hypothetical protein
MSRKKKRLAPTPLLDRSAPQPDAEDIADRDIRASCEDQAKTYPKEKQTTQQEQKDVSERVINFEPPTKQPSSTIKTNGDSNTANKQHDKPSTLTQPTTAINSTVLPSPPTTTTPPPATRPATKTPNLYAARYTLIPLLLTDYITLKTSTLHKIHTAQTSNTQMLRQTTALQHELTQQVEYQRQGLLSPAKAAQLHGVLGKQCEMNRLLEAVIKKTEALRKEMNGIGVVEFRAAAMASAVAGRGVPLGSFVVTTGKSWRGVLG